MMVLKIRNVVGVLEHNGFIEKKNHPENVKIISVTFQVSGLVGVIDSIERVWYLEKLRQKVKQMK